MTRVTIKKENREKVWNKYNHHCAYCGQIIEYRDMQVDHVISIKRGGKSTISNLNPSCRRCNHYKRAGTLEHFRKMLSEMEEKVLGTYLGKVAKDYGMVKWVRWDKKFFFERNKK